ncbi:MULTISPECIES: hypothetical protein [Providencia]|uniref:hypothetical protein n=1 Tax=Providencia TaxID=586 RepID=UPI00234B90D9|nr:MULTISPECIES: hypothetical protein [unclassified Providencia]ELR5140197.1 hypothetical protein [Providencia rettgeri]
MTEEDWVDSLRWLPDREIIKLHFSLQEKIKKHYKMRDVGDNLNRAIEFCKQQIALSSLAISALKKNENMYHDGVFYSPTHHGYQQYAVILRKNKELSELSRIRDKMISEGWSVK